MRLATIDDGTGPRLVAELHEGALLDLVRAEPGTPPTMRGLLAAGDDMMRLARETIAAARQMDAKAMAAARASGVLHDAATVSWLPPVVDPGKMIMVGSNYKAHLKENEKVPGGQPEKAGARPHIPHAFPKVPQTLVGHNVPMRLSSLTTQFDYETELCLVIGRRCKAVDAANYRDVVGGYTILNDASMRDLQYAERTQGLFIFGKNLDATAPCGPFLVTDDEIDDPQDLRLRCWVNGEIRQDETTANMIFSLGELVAHCSRDLTLEPGDLIATGCPAGCGIFFDPPEAGLLHDGDLIEMQIDPIGRLSNRVVLQSTGVPSASR